MKQILTILFSLLIGVHAVSAQKNELVDVIIVGGGISGLSAAYQLKKLGLSYTVLEMKPRPGGRIQTVNYPEYHVEAGLAEFWSENPAMQIIKELSLETEESVAFSSVLIDGTVYPYVQDTNEEYLTSLLGKEQYSTFTEWNKTMAEQYQKLEQRPIPAELMKLKEISFKDWVSKNSKLEAKTLEFIRRTVEVEIGTGWESISALDGIDEWSLFLGEGQIPNTVVKGNEALIDAIVKFIGSEHVIVNRQVKNVAQKADRVTVDTLDMSTYQPVSYSGRYVISTVPLYRLLFDINFTPPIPAKIQQAIQSQTWGAYCTILVTMDAKARAFWTIEGVSALPILTNSAVGVIYDGNGNATEDQEKILSLLTTGPWAERFNLQPQDQTEAEIRRTLDSIWPGSAKMVQRIELFRQHPRAIAAWPVGRSRFDDLSEAVRAPHGRLYLAGDFTENSHSSGAVSSGFRTAKAIAERVKAEKK